MHYEMYLCPLLLQHQAMLWREGGNHSESMLHGTQQSQAHENSKCPKNELITSCTKLPMDNYTIAGIQLISPHLQLLSSSALSKCWPTEARWLSVIELAPADMAEKESPPDVCLPRP